MLSRDELRLLLLSLIDTTDQHGYELIRRVKALSRGTYAPSSGMVYPALAELEEAGLAVHSEGEGGRKLFVATETGIAKAAARKTEITALRQRLERFASTVSTAPVAIRRALANLDLVLDHALAGANQDHVDAIVELIDAMARQIERLDGRMNDYATQ